jgi:16S rRNA (guanine1516-N2)-methyltransferase
MKSGKPNDEGTEPRSLGPEVTLAPGASCRDLEIAARFGLRSADERNPSGWQLLRCQGVLQLAAPFEAGGWTVALDAGRGALQRRLSSARRNDALPRAVGLPRRATPPDVVDATAGLGRDAMALASLGCRVTAIERVPALAFLLCAALDRVPFRDRVLVVPAEATPWLSDLPAAEAPAVVYLDPMFPTAGRAQVKKEMQACRALAGPPTDAVGHLNPYRSLYRAKYAQSNSVAPAL